MNLNAKEIYLNSLIIDGHFAVELSMPGSIDEKWALIDSYAKAGVTSVSLSLANDENKLEETLNYLALFRQHIFSHSDKYILANSSQDILHAKQEKKLAIRLMFQGACSPLDINLNLAEIYNALGISSMIIAYNIRTYMGDGCIEEIDAGISHLGRQLVAKMNAIGMIIDGAHSSTNTILAAVEVSRRPLIISHACTYGINPIPRNLKDEVIKAVAKSGGVIGVNGIGLLLGDKNASIKKYVDHIDYLVNLVGIEHVGIGLDNFYFGDQFHEFMKAQPITNPSAYGKMVDPSMFNCIKPNQLMDVVEELIQRKYTLASIQAFLGENFLRVIKAHE